MQAAQVSWGLFLLVLGLCLNLCQPARAQAPNWHEGLHLARFKPRSIDSKTVVGASTAHIVSHTVPKRGLAAAANTPAPSEFVSASATYFQVGCNQLVPVLIMLVTTHDHMLAACPWSFARLFTAHMSEHMTCIQKGIIPPCALPPPSPPTIYLGYMSYISLVHVLAQVRGKQTFFAGTNIFYILLRQTADDPLGFTDDGVTAYLSAQVCIPTLLASTQARYCTRCD